MISHKDSGLHKTKSCPKKESLSTITVTAITNHLCQTGMESLVNSTQFRQINYGLDHVNC